MKKIVLLFILSPIMLVSCFFQQGRNHIELKTNSLLLVINESGSLKNLIDLKSHIDYLYKDTLSPLMSIRSNGEIINPQSAQILGDTIELQYKGGIEAHLRVDQNSSHLSFELLSVSHNQDVDLIIWGPYALSIDEVIGETVGIVQGSEYAIGMQALNPKTLGGYPWNENDCMPQLDIFENGNYSDLNEAGKRYVLYRVEAAKPTDFGSSLQAYCRKRDQDRVIENWDHPMYLAPAYDDGGYVGSRMALFGCPLKDILDYVEEIELAEGLPHPMIDGVWTKKSPAASSAYLILDFSEKDIENALAITKQAGLSYLYHSGPFENWGHFDLNKKQFPQGIESMKYCVDKAKEEGIKLGLHTLSNFITTNDAYVTPIPDQRLAKVGSSILKEGISKTQSEIPVESPVFFNQFKNNHLKTVMIGEELIRYGSVSKEEPWTLLDCERGAFKTSPSSHDQGNEISKLADHGYKVFLTNTALSKEVAENIANLFNATGIRQISFDGLEGNRSTGTGNYGEVLFTNAWYELLNQDIKNDFIADASRTSHYFWHIYTRMNWGEPWYAGFRESQTEYRLKNQKYFKRNLMPGMLGWFSMKPETSVEDIEWLLARSAAFDAGFAFVTNYETLARNGNTEKILSLIGAWESIRMEDRFSEAQKERMADISREFTLENIHEKEWSLQEVFSGKFKHEMKVRQPGEPLYSVFEYENKGAEQTLQFIISAVGAHVSDIILEKDHHKSIALPARLKQGQIIKYQGGSQALVYDKNWQLLSTFEVNADDFKISKGSHTITMDCLFSDSNQQAHLKVEFRTLGEAEPLLY